jgi:hypothetical protein
MKTAIMQPYFLPYVGYFQLIAAVNKFVLYDRIKYTKKGWINRNRMLLNGSDAIFSLPLKKGSDSLEVVEREISDDFSPGRLLAQFSGAYKKAPNFEETYELLRLMLNHDDRNLFRFIHYTLTQVCSHLGIDTDIQISSSLPFDNELKGEDKVLAICKAVGAKTYLNSIGGKEIYSRESFAEHGIELKFLNARTVEYRQFGANFVPFLSIIDLLMFNTREAVSEVVSTQFDLL